MSGFDALHPVVQHHVVNTLGWRDLRPLQEAAVEPLVAGEDALLLAPTAGGKTEAAVFPILTRMSTASWTGTSVLYICPLRALLNNLEYRVDTYAKWIGRSAAVRHGDTAQGVRRRLAAEHPEILMTTPESIEAMLVSSTLDPRVLLGGVRAVIVDEIHAFAGDDRGWHLLAVLERLTHLTGRPLQRVGLSATVGNAEDLLTWLQGSNRRSGLSGAVISPPPESAVESDVALDYVGSVDNAAKVVSLLHRGEKRLVFADSRRTVEQLGVRLGELDVDTYVSHSSLSASERRRSETAFAEARDCVIVATSTLELGIDVGDLDRVLQVGAPTTVASFLQRLGRTGRRPGSSRNATLLASNDQELLRAAGLLLLWSEGFVESITAPPTPAHIAAQQVLAITLQERRVGRHTWRDWIGDLALVDPEDEVLVIETLLERGWLDADQDMLMVGPEAEGRYGRRHFMELMSVFTSDPQVAVLHGRTEIGAVDPMVLLTKVQGPRRIALAGRSWAVNSVDWDRKRAYVEPSDGVGLARWMGSSSPLSFELVDAMRRTLLGSEPRGVELTRRARQKLDELREEHADRLDPDRTALLHSHGETRWWTWAGTRANAVIWAALNEVAPHFCDSMSTVTNDHLVLRSDTTAAALREALLLVKLRFGTDLASVVPEVSERAIKDLKFSDMLPSDLAIRTLAARLSDHPRAAEVMARGLVERRSSEG